MKYTFNEVFVYETKESVSIMVEEMPAYADYFPTKKQKRYLGYLIAENNVKVTGDVKRLSNMTVNRVIAEIGKNPEKEITLIVNKSQNGRTSMEDGTKHKFFNDNSDLPF